MTLDETEAAVRGFLYIFFLHEINLLLRVICYLFPVVNIRTFRRFRPIEKSFSPIESMHGKSYRFNDGAINHVSFREERCFF